MILYNCVMYWQVIEASHLPKSMAGGMAIAHCEVSGAWKFWEPFWSFAIFVFSHTHCSMENDTIFERYNYYWNRPFHFCIEPWLWDEVYYCHTFIGNLRGRPPLLCQPHPHYPPVNQQFTHEHHHLYLGNTLPKRVGFSQQSLCYLMREWTSTIQTIQNPIGSAEKTPGSQS